MQLVKEVYASWRAEVVFITSNRQGNQEIMEGCKEAGIPAFVSQAHYLCPMASDFRRGFRERCGTSNEMSSAKHDHYLFILFYYKPSIPKTFFSTIFKILNIEGGHQGSSVRCLIHWETQRVIPMMA